MPRLSSCLGLERLQGNSANFNKKEFQDLYQNRLDGPITGHVLEYFFRSLKMFICKTGQAFPQPLYLGSIW